MRLSDRSARSTSVPDTIYALSNGRLPAAIAIIRISGPIAHEVGKLMAGPLPEPRFAAVREIRNPQSDDLIDQALVLRFDGPASSTGEDVVEFQCHGSRAVVDAVFTALSHFPGARQAEPGEFTRRMFENGRIDLTEAEGLADLLEAETEAQRKAALALTDGALKRQIAGWQERLLELSARAERAIDYSEDDESGVDPDLARGCQSLAEELGRWLKRPRLEPLKDGIRIVVAGPPNSGKSSLINAMTGLDRAIVTDIPGTTRDHIEVPLSIGGMPILLTDTAGLRATRDPVEAIGVGRAEALVRAADILIWLGDDDAPDHAKLIRIQPKADLSEGNSTPPERLPVSSRTGQGLSELLEQILSLARSLLPQEDAIALNRRQASCLEDSAAALNNASRDTDPVIVAEELRTARNAFDRLTGRAGIDDVLDSLFSRFCLGK